ncbi:hypothetical protein BASA62_007322 [Batrachochytrium salamandrivorans]|nr:hypothetical protein BASA62_007322 [Batrachochytrium salamandrivorans]
MRFSTGIILSILLANVFAIEHPNDAHPSSLLARRAVVADADGVFLEKRNNDKKQKKPAKSKTSVPNLSSSQENLCRDDSDSDSNSIDGAEGVPQTSVFMTPIKVVGLRVEEEISTQALVLTKGCRALPMLLETLPSILWSYQKEITSCKTGIQIAFW